MINQEKMPQVQLIAKTDMSLENLVSYDALTCTRQELPILGETIPIGSVYESGHHSTLECNYYTFAIEYIPIGVGIDFGLHVASPHYNTGQRSGRYVQDMFANPPRKLLAEQLKMFYHGEIGESVSSDILDYLEFCIGVFKKRSPEAEKICARFLKEDRPKASSEYIEGNAPKMAQEQLRGVIPVIFPTALTFTVNFITAASLYAAAWNPYMRYVTSIMMKQIFAVEDSKETRKIKKSLMSWKRENWAPGEPKYPIAIIDTPIARLLSVNFPPGIEFITPHKRDIDVLDLLPVHPRYMNNGTINMQVEMGVSLATYGQDQRHRSIRRSEPQFTNGFYAPPLIQEIGMEDDIHEVMSRWNSFIGKVPDTLFAGIAPYNAMVGYIKSADVNSFIHDAVRRYCNTAQEENNTGFVLLRSAVKEAAEKDPRLNPLVKLLAPPCWEGGVCHEKIRQCGRDRSKKARSSEEYFARRRV